MGAYFTRRAQGAAVVAGALSLAALFEVQNSDPGLFNRLTGRALPLVVLAGVCGLAVLALLTAGRTLGIRAIAALGVAAVIWGWGVAQYPVLLPGTTVTLSNAGAPHDTLVALVVVFIAALVLVVPSFTLLFTLQSRHLLSAGQNGTAPATASVAQTRPRPHEEQTSGMRAAVLGLVAVVALTPRRRRHTAPHDRTDTHRRSR
jgi:cytochrome d ubiquinol oxidase subunit II